MVAGQRQRLGPGQGGRRSPGFEPAVQGRAEPVGRLDRVAEGQGDESGVGGGLHRELRSGETLHDPTLFGERGPGLRRPAGPGLQVGHGPEGPGEDGGRLPGVLDRAVDEAQGPVVVALADQRRGGVDSDPPALPAESSRSSSGWAVRASSAASVNRPCRMSPCIPMR